MPPLPTPDLDHALQHVTGFRALSGARLFITGGTGFVGKWLVETLLTASDRLDLRLSAAVLTRDPDQFRSSSPHLAEHPALTLVKGDVQTFEFPDGEFPFVIHAATEAAADAARPDATFQLDLDGTRRVLEFAHTHGARRFLFTSSGAVYGKQPPDLTHVSEEYPGAPLTTDPGSAYGQAKRASEFLCTMYARHFGFACPIARLFAFVGPHLPMNANYAVGNFIRDALAGGPIRVNGDGTPWRSYLYAADLASWLWTILLRGDSGRAYNVGSDKALTIAELAETVALVAGNATEVEIAGKTVPGAPAQRYVPSVERARRELGLMPLVGVEEGVRRTMDWAR